jgi:Ca-activated chloride channel family protein
MDTVLQIDHHGVDSEQSPNGQPGIVVRALLSVRGIAPERSTRAPIALSFVIDRSGSMDGDRIESARLAAARAVERLHPDDVISVVAFDDIIETVAGPDRRARLQQLADTLLQLEARGSTNLSGGWLRGREHMQQAQGMIGDLPGSSRRIVLLTDGHANMGIVEPSTLVELARTARSMGISTTTVGIGDGYDDALLRAMADAGGGNAWYIERPDQSQDVLAEELGNLLSVCAQGITVRLTLATAVSVMVVHSDWPCATPEPGVFHFDLGDLYAAEPKPLLLELFVPHERLTLLATNGAPIATATVSADVILSGGRVEHRTLHLPIASTLVGQQQLEPEVESAVLLARAAKAREEAARRQRNGEVDLAESLMRAHSVELANSPLYHHPDYAEQLMESASDLTVLADKYQQGTFSELDAKYQLQRTYNQRRGKHKYDEQLRRKPPEQS